MYQKLVGSLSFFIGGFCIVLIGMLFIIKNVILYENLISILAHILFLIGLLLILKNISKKNNNSITKGLISIIISFFLISIPSIPLKLLPIFIAIYLFLNSIICIFYSILLYKTKASEKTIEFLKGIFYFIIGIPLMLFPLVNLKTVLIILGIYFIIVGFFFIKDSVYMIISEKTKKKIKRKIHISLPIFITALIPYSVFKEINNYINNDKVVKTTVKNNIDDYDLEVFIHVSNSKFGSIGHVDLYYNGEVISYGNYDMYSRKLGEAMGDGVLFICKSKEKYLQFCRKHSKKLLFGFGLKLSKNQKQKIEEKINEIKGNLYEWIPYYKRSLLNKENISKDDYQDYASSLYKITKAKFYKFKVGKFKKFFILKTNCALLVDSILGAAGTDIIRINGIIAPGSYYDYLYREFCKKKSMVVSYNIYIGKEKLVKK